RIAKHRRAQLVVELLHAEYVLDVLAIFVLEQDPVQQVIVPLAVRLEVPQERRARVGDLPIARTAALELFNQPERGLDKALRSDRVADKADRQAVLLARTFREAWLDTHAVGPAEALPQRAVQVSAQGLRHRTDDHAMRLVVLKRPGEHDAHLALGLDASSHFPLD